MFYVFIILYPEQIKIPAGPQSSDQLGLICTHLLQISQHLEALVKVGKVLSNAAKVCYDGPLDFVVSRIEPLCVCARVCVSQDVKRDKVAAALARTKARDGLSDHKSDSDDEAETGEEEDSAGSGSGIALKNLKEEVQENVQAKAGKRKKTTKKT